MPRTVLARWVMVAFLLVVNVAGYWLAGHDKRQAQRRRDRIPERTFLLLALMGGGIGTYVGFAAHRHKTRKLRFLLPFIAAALLGAVLAGAWLALL